MGDTIHFIVQLKNRFCGFFGGVDREAGKTYLALAIEVYFNLLSQSLITYKRTTRLQSG
jgi:hypothetical protein